MDSDSPIASRIAGEPSNPTGETFTFAMRTLFKSEFGDAFRRPTCESGRGGRSVSVRAFRSARAADCGDGRCRHAYHPSAPGHGHPA